MIETKEKSIEELLNKAILKLKSNQDFQLVSLTKKIDDADPLQFFEAAKTTEKDRTFWASTDDTFSIVGIGNAFEIIAEENRFEITEDQWNNLVNEAIIHNPYKKAGTGIVAIGGMEFDPKKEKTKLWNNFKASHFTIPEFILTKHHNDCYFTVNIYVQKEDHPIQLAKEIMEAEKKLFTYTRKADDDLVLKNKVEISPETWKETVRQATKEISQNKAEKIVLARELRLKFNKRADIGLILEKLLDMQPNSYIFAFEKGEDCFIGATPERLVKIDNERLLSTCLAGTAPRGKTKEEDIKISYELLHDEKNREEHDFVVKMIRNKIKDYCSGIDIPDEPVVYPLKNLQHLYTPVTASLKKGYSIFDVIKQLHPTPALGGTPREESLSFIRDNELLDRGWYGAPIGWLDSGKNSEFVVAIRSGLIQGDEASLFAGCGVVADSDPEAEYEETNVKFLPMLSVLGE
ncbi:isochorismate synthase [Virgibacillus ainsalahensis]